MAWPMMISTGTTSERGSLIGTVASGSPTPVSYLDWDYNDYRHACRNTRSYRLKKEAVRVRAKGLCEVCENNPMDEVHHRHYRYVSDCYNAGIPPEDLDEPLSSLFAICRPCHEFQSNKSDFDPRGGSGRRGLDAVCIGVIDLGTFADVRQIGLFFTVHFPSKRVPGLAYDCFSIDPGRYLSRDDRLRLFLESWLGRQLRSNEDVFFGSMIGRPARVSVDPECAWSIESIAPFPDGLPGPRPCRNTRCWNFGMGRHRLPWWLPHEIRRRILNSKEAKEGFRDSFSFDVTVSPNIGRFHPRGVCPASWFDDIKR